MGDVEYPYFYNRAGDLPVDHVLDTAKNQNFERVIVIGMVDSSMHFTVSHPDAAQHLLDLETFKSEIMDFTRKKL